MNVLVITKLKLELLNFYPKISTGESDQANGFGVR